ncbi:MAG: lipoprotein N-acyltransferase Lnb domain-containing protein, partial [Flavisolibacter sp.]
MKKLLIVLLFSFYLINSSIAQADSCHLRITLITCSPGEELYSSFGHTALRIENNSDGTDLFFNYGTFEFDDDFYMKFIRGKLDYFLSIQSQEEFMYQYQMEGRTVIEQELI